MRSPDHDDPVICCVELRDEWYVGTLRILEVTQVTHVGAALGINILLAAQVVRSALRGAWSKASCSVAVSSGRRPVAMRGRAGWAPLWVKSGGADGVVRSTVAVVDVAPLIANPCVHECGQG